MRQLDTCDFCGDAPEGVFEVVPGDVDGGPVRLALCGDCRDTLATVTDPLLAADSGTDPAGDTDPSPEEPASDGDDTDEAAPADEFESATADADTDETADADDESGVTIEEQGGGTPAKRPDGYAQLLRLLQNRDGAMPRGDLKALATNAYDLREDTFEAAIEAAVANGDVEETRQGLRTT